MKTAKLYEATRRAAWAATIVLAVALIGTAGAAHAATERRETLAGSATGGTTRTPTPVAPGEVQLMRGFDLRYLNGDHHIRSIAVLPDSDDLGITFDDRNGDDPMQYLVSLTKVQLAGVISPPTLSRTCSGGTCTFPLQAPHPTATTSSSSGVSGSPSCPRMQVSHSPGTATFSVVATIT